MYVFTRSRGFGFITYGEAKSLDEAQKNRPHHIDGRDTDTKRAMPRDVIFYYYLYKFMSHVHTLFHQVQGFSPYKNVLTKLRVAAFTHQLLSVLRVPSSYLNRKYYNMNGQLSNLH